MRIHSDHELLQRLRNESSSSFSLLYEMYFSSVASFVKQNLGNNEDAEDIFQEAIVVLLQEVRKSEFQLTSTLKTYLFAIAKHLWLRRLRDNKLATVDIEQELAHQVEAEPFIIEINPEKSKEEQVQMWLQKITANCKRILTAIFFHQQPMNELMATMGWKNKHTAANQKYKCIEQLRRESEKDS